MEEMAPVPFLVIDDRGRKLRRAVPKDIREQVGRTAWIERLGQLSAEQVRRRAHAFAASTDDQIAECRARKLDAVRDVANAASIVSLDLTRDQADEVARAYFADVEHQRLVDRTYVRAADAADDDDPILVAAQDLAQALEAASGRQTYLPNDAGSSTPRQAWRLLQEAKRLPPVEGKRSRLPPAIVGAPNFQYLCRLLERADVELAQRKLDSVQTGSFPAGGDAFFQPAVPSATQLVPTRANQRTLGNLIAEFEQRKQREVGASRLSQFKLATRALLEELGSKKVLGEVSRQDCQGVVDLLVRAPAYVSQHYTGMTVRSAADAYAQKHGQAAAREVEAQRPFAVIKAIFALAVQLDWIATDPAAKIELPKPHVSRKKHGASDGYQPFEIAELNRIFRSPLYVGCVDDEAGFNRSGPNVPKRSRYWVPLISLWSGLRMTEALQLEREDIRTVDGVRAIVVNDTVKCRADCASYAKRLKNTNAARDVPIHRVLEELGFVEWALSRDPGPLFPEAFVGGFELSSNQFSKRFANFLKSVHLWVPRKKVFHSLRNNFNDALRAGGVAQEHRETLCGWSSQRSMDRRYGKGHKLNLLSKEIDKAVFDGLDVGPLSQLRTVAVRDVI